MNSTHALTAFNPAVQSWFKREFGEPSPPQRLGWPPISKGQNTLLVAPTGSGKTLAAFLWCINHLVEENLAVAGSDEHEELCSTSRDKPTLRRRGRVEKGNRNKGIRVLYISPLKALNNDIYRNLESPLKGIHEEATAQGIHFAKLRSAVRTGDTTQAERAAILKNPPDILITTPESLYLMLSSPKARKIFFPVRYVIVDEIHSVCGNKRGVHLMLSLERLERLTEKPFVRIGLSATQKPLDVIARFLGGLVWQSEKLVPRDVVVVDAGYRKQMDLQVACVAQDFSDLPADGIWPLLLPKLLDAILRHTTTLIFVNNRRLAERVAAKLNELLEGQEHMLHNYAVPVPPPDFKLRESLADIRVQAYHGSMSRAAREKMESDLKAGRLRVLVATSALELGIDIGSVDLVIQVQSPKGVARGLQRVGRSGHLVSATSKGRIYVTHRDDLVESAVVAKAMEQHDIEATHIPHDCIDVLAQQIVSMVSVEEWPIDDLFDLVRQCYCYQSLSRKVFLSVVQMLAGRYADDAFRELRPRVSWNKLHNRLSALPGSSHLAITNAGTIPDRGYYGVFLENHKTKIGEVDEEFIYESRTGDTFILGSNVWRIAEIDANRIVVTPAPGQPARMPFWKGEAIGRTFEVGEAVGKFMEHAANIDSPEQLRADYPVDHFASWNIIDYVTQQKAATKAVPSHRTIVVEGFRDEIGDPRIVVHSCFGRGVNGLMGLVLSRRLREQLGTEAQMLYNDNGVLFRCPDVDRLPLDLFSNLSLPQAREFILEELLQFPLFGALFRQNAERALLLPKARVGKRTPLFLQRLRAGDLLQVARKYDDFPIVIETVRDCLNDVLDFEHFIRVMAMVESGDIGVHTVQTELPSPFASSIVFDFVATYMYEQDKPRAETAGQSLNRELLTEVVGIDAAASVAKPEALLRIEEQLQFTADTRKARSPEELLEIFLRIGELTAQEIEERCVKGESRFRIQLESRKTILPLLLGRQQYYIPAEEVPLYLELAILDPQTIASLPEEFRTPVLEREKCLRFLIVRMLRSHGPLTSQQIADRYNLTMAECESLLQSFPEEHQIIHGTFSPNAEAVEWCCRPNLERIHRASINLLRQEIKPSTLADFTNFLLGWQHRDSPSQESGETGLRIVLEQLEGCALGSELWEGDIFRPRMQHYEPVSLRTLASRGEVICTGAGSGRAEWVFRGDGAFFAVDKDTTLRQLSPTARELYDFLKLNGASFLSDIRDGTSFSLAALNKALAELFWTGLITNDVVDEVLNIRRFISQTLSQLPAERAVLTNPRRNPLKYAALRSVRRALRATPGWHGRWSLVHTRSVLGEKISPEEKATRQAQQLLLRYGIVAREIARREENLLPWPLLALQFQRMELRGEIRRGYFVEGLSGMQFALPAAGDTLREISNNQPKPDTGAMIVVNACDPANPFGVGIPLVGADGIEQTRIGRSPLNHIVFADGKPLLYSENFCARIAVLHDRKPDPVGKAVRELVSHLRSSYPRENELVLEYCNGIRPTESPYAPALRAVGFYRDRAQTMRCELR